jgi:hypothetical protein
VTAPIARGFAALRLIAVSLRGLSPKFFPCVCSHIHRPGTWCHRCGCSYYEADEEAV